MLASEPEGRKHESPQECLTSQCLVDSENIEKSHTGKITNQVLENVL